MSELILQHCVDVEVLPTDVPTIVELTYAIGGAWDDGRVEVTAGDGELAVPLCLPTGSTGAITLPHASKICVHYYKSLTGPDELTVDVDAVRTL